MNPNKLSVDVHFTYNSYIEYFIFIPPVMMVSFPCLLYSYTSWPEKVHAGSSFVGLPLATYHFPGNHAFVSLVTTGKLS